MNNNEHPDHQIPPSQPDTGEANNPNKAPDQNSNHPDSQPNQEIHNIDKSDDLAVEVIQHLRDCKTHIKWINRQEKLRSIGDALDRRFFTGATIAASAVLGGSALSGIVGGIGGPIIGIIAGAATGSTVALRFPHMLFGSRRYHATQRFRLQAEKTYALAKIYDRIVSIQDLLKTHNIEFTTEQNTYLRELSTEILDELISNIEHTNKRKKREEYEKIKENTKKQKHNLRKMRKEGKKFESVRKRHLNEKYAQLEAKRKAKSELEKQLGKTFVEYLSYLIDPNEEKKLYKKGDRSEDTLTHLGKTYVKKKSSLLYTPSDYIGNTVGKDWDERVIIGIQNHFNHLDEFGQGFKEIFEELFKELFKQFQEPEAEQSQNTPELEPRRRKGILHLGRRNKQRQLPTPSENDRPNGKQEIGGKETKERSGPDERQAG